MTSATNPPMESDRSVASHPDDLDAAAWDGRGILNTPDGPVAGGETQA
ncbi:hypothetical protein ACFWUT_35310 [Streptomyces cyaneofuscatus]